ncbi:hypothetical protein VTG60DRAFT_5056 [Thermothelomyces hinnuleus]
MADSTGSRDAANILIEIGPHPALQGPVNQILATVPGFKGSYVAPLWRGKNAADSFSAATARLFELGAKVNFGSLFAAEAGARRVLGDLLPYPWDHRVRHWAESRLSRDHRLRRFPYHDLLGVYDVTSPIEEPRWRHHLSVQRLPWLRDHVVDGMLIFPGAGYATMGVEAMRQLVQMRNPAGAPPSASPRPSCATSASPAPSSCPARRPRMGRARTSRSRSCSARPGSARTAPGTWSASSPCSPTRRGPSTYRAASGSSWRRSPSRKGWVVLLPGLMSAAPRSRRPSRRSRGSGRWPGRRWTWRPSTRTTGRRATTGAPASPC